MINLIKNNKTTFGWIFLFFLFLLTTINLNFCGDDITYSKCDISTVNTFAKFLYKSYLTWETRIICRFIESILTHTSIWIWRCCYAGMYILLIYSLKDIFELNKRNTFYIVLLVMMFPMNTMNNAGWVATTCNYFFPCVCGIYFFSIAKRVYQKKQVIWWKYLFSILSLIYATDHEQTIFCILSLLSIFIYLQHNQHSISKFFIISLCVSCVMLLKIIFSPALKSRYISEIISWYPDYGILNIIDKIHLGFVSTFSYLYHEHVLLWASLCVLVAIAVWEKYENITLRIITIIPAISFFTYIFFVNIYNFEKVGSVIGFPVAGILTSIGVMKLYTYFAIFSFVLSFLGILVGVYLIFESNTNGWIAPVGLLIVFASRMIMGFSPTLFASSTRTFCSFLFGIMILIIAVVKKINFQYSECANFLRKCFCQLGICFSVMLWINMLLTK